MTWLVAFVLTCAVEFALVFALAPPAQRARIATDSLAANLCTHPPAFWLVTQGHAGFWPVEFVVWLGEAAIYASVSRLPALRALATSLAANGVTLAMSFLF